MNNQTIAAEFTKSVIKAIEKQASARQSDPLNTQVGILADRLGTCDFFSTVNYGGQIDLTSKDVIVLPPLYSMFRSQIEKKLKERMALLAQQGGGAVLVYFSLLRKGIRAVFYARGEYVRDLTMNEIISL